MKSFNINSIIKAMVIVGMIAVSNNAMAANSADKGKYNNNSNSGYYNKGGNKGGNSGYNAGYEAGYNAGYSAGNNAGYNAGYKNGKRGFYDNGFGYRGASMKDKKKFMKMGYYFDNYGNMYKYDRFGKKKYYNKFGKEVFYINIGGFVFYVGF